MVDKSFAAAALHHCYVWNTTGVRRWDTKDGTKALCLKPMNLPQVHFIFTLCAGNTIVKRANHVLGVQSGVPPGPARVC